MGRIYLSNNKLQDTPAEIM